MGFFETLSSAGELTRVVWMLLAVELLLSAATFLAYAADKKAARSRAWRTRESTLHVMALLGGWPGALMAQRVYRHKTKKQPFKTIFWFTVAGNLAIVVSIIAAAMGVSWY